MVDACAVNRSQRSIPRGADCGGWCTASPENAIILPQSAYGGQEDGSAQMHLQSGMVHSVPFLNAPIRPRGGSARNSTPVDSRRLGSGTARSRSDWPPYGTVWLLNSWAVEQLNSWIVKNRKPRIFRPGVPVTATRAYLFLWRCAFMRLSYLCFDIFFRRFFLMEPIVDLL